MKIAVLGTGMVGQAHAGQLARLGHIVYMGTNDPAKTRSRTKLDTMERPGVGLWLNANPAVRLVTFNKAAAAADIIINALSGKVALSILKGLEYQIGEKLLIDISNPLDFSSGELRLTVCNTDSLAEQIQAALPKASVVKGFNTMNASVQVAPKSVASGRHELFIAGNSAEAKSRTRRLAKQWYGWEHIIDLGELKAARGMEMILPIWLDIMRAQASASFNFHIAK